MTEEAKASQSEDRAAEGAIETAEDIQAKQRDAENAERSKLGRKVKELEDQLSVVGDLREQMDRIASMLATKQNEEDDDDIVTTKSLETYLGNYLQKTEQQRTAAQQTYEKNYTSAFAKIGVDDDNFDAVWNEMLERHNVIHTGDPKIDAQLNYLAAQNALLKKPKNPLQGKGADVKGVNTPGETKDTPKGMPKLDPAAEEFVKRMNLSPEWVSKTLNQQ